MTVDVVPLQRRLRVFAEDRDWVQFHSPKNLASALAVEAAELLEIFQWMTEDESITVVCAPTAFAAVLQFFDKLNLKYESAELTKVPDTTVKVSGDDVDKVLRLIEKLEDLDDVQKVFANFDVDAADWERLASAG